MAEWLTWFALSLWLGAMGFFSFVVAPTVFQALDGESAGRFLRTVFPRYYLFGAGCSVVLVLAALIAPAAGGWVLAGGVALAALALGSLALVPAINRARDAGAAGAQRFRRLHGASVALNLVALLVAVGVSIALVRA